MPKTPRRSFGALHTRLLRRGRSAARRRGARLMPNILDNEELYNVIVLKGVSSPGKVTLYTGTIPRKAEWDVMSLARQ